MENNTNGTGSFHCFIEQFFNLDDAEYFVECHIEDHPKDEWELAELRINLIGGLFRAGVSFRRIAYQTELDFGYSEVVGDEEHAGC